ncbi:MAG: hypothetical protein AAGJ52_09525 [Pseudomonadota bacterium]
MKTSFYSLFLMVICSAFSQPLTATSLESAFTYQGELLVADQPAQGLFDLRFELFDAQSGNSQVGTTIILEDVVVSRGLFSVELDFGTSVFDGQQIWVELGARNGDSTGGFTELLPRQKLTAAPYALYAETVGADSIGGVELIDGAVGAAEIDSAAVQRRVDGVCVAGSFVTAVNEDGSLQCAPDGPGQGIIQTLSIGPAAFTPRESSTEYQKTLGNGGTHITGGSGVFVGLVAPVELPDGAVVTQVRARYVDNSSTENLRLVFATEFFDGGFNFIGDVSTSGVESFRREITVLDSSVTINNQTQTYFVMGLNPNWVSETFNLRIISFEIDYQLN